MRSLPPRTKQRTEVDRVQAAVEADDDMAKQADRMKEIKGVGKVTVATLLALLPELER